MKSGIVVVGSSNTDMVVKLARLPGRGETLMGGEFFQLPGGKGANQAVAAARLGAAVTLVSRVGKDPLGEEALAGFGREGLDTRYVVRDDRAPSGVALILVEESGENMIAVAPGANGLLSCSDVDRARDAITSAWVVLLQLEVPIETVQRAARLGKESGACVILNPAPAQPLSKELLGNVSILTPNLSEAEILSGSAIRDESSAVHSARQLLKMGAGAVIVTLGAKGVCWVTPDSWGMIPARAVEAVDATAAGDAFNGALAQSIAAGQQLRDAVEFANQAAALSVTRLGAQPSLPTLAELKRFAGN